MMKRKRKSTAQQIFNLKMTAEQHAYVERAAKIQGHGNKSLVIKKLLDREMSAA